jgi:hypothetical protein
MQPDPEDDDAAQKADHFDNYSEYAKTLRAWLVAYGIGGPVLFVTNDKLAKQVSDSAAAAQVVSAFLLGVALQVLIAFINKWGAWHMYVGAGDSHYQTGRRYRSWSFVNRQSWIDVTVDVVSIAAFFFGTWRVLLILLAPSV